GTTELAAVRAGGLCLPHLRAGPHDLLTPVAAGTVNAYDQLAVQGQAERLFQLMAGRVQKFDHRAVFAQRKLHWPGIRLVAQAVLAEGQPGRVELVADAVEDHGRACRDRHSVQQLERFLDLQGRHHRSDRGGGGNLAGQNLVAFQQRAAITQVEKLIVALGHRTFIAGRIGRYEDLDDPLNLLNARIDPGSADLPALAVHPEPGLAVVKAADDQVNVGEQPQPQVGEDVAVHRHDGDLGV